MALHTISRGIRLMAAVLMMAGLMVSLSPTEAQAQRQGGGQRGPGGRMGMLNSPGLNRLNLLGNESVQGELKLSDDQKTKLTALGETVRGEMQSAFAELGELDPEDREEKMQELRKTAQERGKAVQQEIAAVLSPEQVERLKQLNLQIRGVSALGDEEVAADLKLSEEQTKQLAEIQSESATAMQDAFRQARESGGGDRDAMRTKMEGLRKSANDKAMAVLSADQKAQFEKMQGAKADLRFEGPMGGGGRGRRPQGA